MLIVHRQPTESVPSGQTYLSLSNFHCSKIILYYCYTRTADKSIELPYNDKDASKILLQNFFTIIVILILLLLAQVTSTSSILQK